MRGMGWDGVKDNGKIVGGWAPPVKSHTRPGYRPFEPSLRRNSGMFDTGLSPKDDQDGNDAMAKRPTAMDFSDGQARRKQMEGGAQIGTYKSWKAPLDPTQS